MLTRLQTSDKRAFLRQNLDIPVYHPEGAYAPSRFLVRQQVPGGQLLLSTLTGEVYLCTSEADDVPALVEAGLYVPEGTDEGQQVERLKRIARETCGMASPVTAYVLTTTDCNARCFYCFEKGIAPLNMEEDTAQATAAYLAFCAEKAAPETLKIKWFGGEPLMNVQAIEAIAGELDARGVPFTSSITTNGYLFTPELVAKAPTHWHLNGATITLDGMEERYNKTKAYVNISADESPFLRVMSNMELLLQAGIGVTARLNVERRNEAELLQLVDALAARFGTNSLFNICVRSLGQEMNKDGVVETIEAHVRQRMFDAGLVEGIALPELNAFHCSYDYGDAVFIHSDGSVYRCENFKHRAPAGSVFNPAEIEEPQVGKYYRSELCEACALQPDCVKLQGCPLFAATCTEEVRAAKLARVRQSLKLWYELKK